jgi:V/A-type H+/Na+-transporting ATPase subunit D
MAKLKHTKNELKKQRDSLKRFERYLPTLILKKQQLQMEVRNLEHRIAEKEDQMKALNSDLSVWIRMISEEPDPSQYISVEEIKRSSGNIAGVGIRVFEGVTFKKIRPDLFATPLWLDDALKAIEQLILLKAEIVTLRESLHLISAELRTTSQRVNLFEKVKIPEARENIRVIRIYLGDQQTSEVARSKIAKGKSLAMEAST